MARVLWINLCSQPFSHGLSDTLVHAHRLLQIDELRNVPWALQHLVPELACVEFDYPDTRLLQAVPRLRDDAPTLPILMFTEYHSEALALWAFRTGVWDYRVKPMEHHVLVRCIEVAARDSDHGRRGLPRDLIEPAGHLVAAPTTAPKTNLAIAYLLKHYQENIRHQVLAELCHLCCSEFSRAFRRENGVTVDGYLLHLRIAKARDFLAEPGMTVARAAYAVGFNDPSYFCRVFRRVVGLTGGAYRRQVTQQPRVLQKRTADLCCDSAEFS